MAAPGAAARQARHRQRVQRVPVQAERAQLVDHPQVRRLLVQHRPREVEVRQRPRGRPARPANHQRLPAVAAEAVLLQHRAFRALRPAARAEDSDARPAWST